MRKDPARKLIRIDLRGVLKPGFLKVKLQVLLQKIRSIIKRLRISDRTLQD
jgi:hypothetical protein